MTDLESPQPSSRVEREVLEILERAEGKSRPVEDMHQALRRQSASLRSQIPQLSGFSLALPPGVYKLAGALVLAIAAAVVVDFSRLGGVILAILSAIAFFSLWFPSRAAPFGDRPRWRGQDLGRPGDIPGSPPDPKEPRTPRWPPR